MRLIDADHFLKTLEKTAENHEQKDAARKIAGAMTFMVEAEAAFFGIGWIPCEKRMPEDGKDVLVCDNGFISIASFEITSEGNRLWEDRHGMYHDWDSYDAWMPLPEVYHE